MTLGWREKDPADTRIYTIDWSPWLSRLGTTISSSSWIVQAGVTNVQQSNTTTSTSIELSGGVDGQEYVIENTVVTVAGQTKKVKFTLMVKV